MGMKRANEGMTRLRTAFRCCATTRTTGWRAAVATNRESIIIMAKRRKSGNRQEFCLICRKAFVVLISTRHCT